MNIITTALLLTTAVTWTDGETPTTIADGAVALTYDGTKVKTLTLSAAVDVEIEGDAMNFAADATITASAAGKVVFSNDVVTAGKLTVGESAQIEYAGDELKPDVYTLMFPGKQLDDYAVKYTQFGNSHRDYQLLYYVGLPFYEQREGDTLTVELQQWDWAFTRGVMIELHQGVEGIEGKFLEADYFEKYSYAFGESFKTNTKKVTRDSKFYSSTSDKKTGYNVDHLVMTNRSAVITSVDFAKKLTLGGQLAVGDLGRVTTSGKNSLAAVRGTFAGDLAVDGEVDFRNHDPFTLSGTVTGNGKFRLSADEPRNYSTSYTNYITKTLQAVSSNSLLRCLKTVGAKMTGSYFGGSIMTTVKGRYLRYNPADNSAECQIQCYQASANCIKCLMVRFEQSGDHVYCKATGARYVTGITDPDAAPDLANEPDSGAPVGNVGREGKGYVIYDFVLGFENEPRTITVRNLTNTMGKAARMELSGAGDVGLVIVQDSFDAVPANGFVDVRANADLQLLTAGKFEQGMHANKGACTIYGVYPGAKMSTRNSYQLSFNEEIRALGGTFENRYTNTSQYFNRIVLKDGGVVTGPGVGRLGYAVNEPHIACAGTIPCTFSMPLTLYSFGVDNKQGTATFSVADTNAAGEATLRLTSAVNFADGKWRVGICKYGLGKILSTGEISIDPSQTNEVAGGTWFFGANNSYAGDLKLSGGTVAVADDVILTPNALTVTANSGVALGSRATLEFASLDLAAGKKLTVAEPYVDNTLRFGTSACLDRTTLKSILIGEKRAHQDDAGWIFANSGLMLIFR